MKGWKTRRLNRTAQHTPTTKHAPSKAQSTAKTSAPSSFTSTTSSDREARERTLVPDLSISPTDLAVAALDEVPDGDTEPDLLEDLVGVLSVQVDRDRLVRFGLELVGKDGDGVLLERPS